MLPFQPESTAQLRLRYSEAVREVYDSENTIGTPDEHRKYVFDFKDFDLRLVISKDKFVIFDNPVIHVSASWIGKFNYDLGMAIKVINEAFLALSGRQELKYIGISPKGVIHLMMESNDENSEANATH